MEKRENTYRIRAHHGLCTAFFEGKGYSEIFVKHMTEIINELEKNPEILLVQETDDICSCCPNCGKGTCNTPEKVLRYDKSVLDMCGLKEGEAVRWQDFRKLVMENIILPGKRENVCGDCQWNSICIRNSVKN